MQKSISRNSIALNAIGMTLAATFLVNSAHAADGAIRFTGTVSASSCTVSNVNNNVSTAGTVNFGQVGSRTLATAGGITESVPFSISLKDCSAASVPRITFSGTAVTTNSYTYLFDTSVSGLGVKIVDASNIATVYTPGVSTANSGLNALSSNAVRTAQANFLAYLQAYTTAEHAGTVDTTVNFVIDYSAA